MQWGYKRKVNLNSERATMNRCKVVFRLNGRGTHQADFMGIPATGKTMTWKEIHICRIVNDKLVEHCEGG